MTPDNLNIALLIAEPIVAIGLIAGLHVRKTDFIEGRWKRQVGMGAVGLVAFCYLFPTFCGHKCCNGQPYFHMYVGFACVIPVIMLVRPGRQRIIAGIVSVMLALVAAGHFNRLVHHGKYIGTTDLTHVFVGRDREAVSTKPLWHSSFTHLYLLETKPKTTPSQTTPSQ